ncbi:hypothetical protein BDF22DRAFT_652184 [Syncephalis plumigaleata]|nr:hypothetical protein BDF22DRAFT_652184 [Syncephalis plumigaleata]
MTISETSVTSLPEESRTSNDSQRNGEDDDEDEDEEEEDVPLAHRLAYERRRLNRRFQRAIENQVQVRRHNSRSRSNQDTLDVDPTRLAPPPPTYAEANIDPPAYDTVKPASSQSSLADISAGTSDNNEIQQDAHASTSTSMTAVIATENEEEDME